MIDINLLKERVNCVDVASQILSLPIRKAGRSEEHTSELQSRE